MHREVMALRLMLLLLVAALVAPLHRVHISHFVPNLLRFILIFA